ncbi:MAG TPA: hypothetical protein VIN07_14840 [Flavipsychrobacter sp.]
MHLGSDKCYQLLAAKNMDEGHGYSISVQDADNLEQTLYGPLSGWPPGYSLTISMAQKATGDYFAAAIALDVFSVVVFYGALALFFVWWGSRFKPWIANLLLVFFAISSAPFYMLFSTDFLSLSFFILSSVVFLRWLETGRRDSRLLVIFLIAAILPGFYRYGFYPLMFVFPACLMVLAIAKKEKKYAFWSIATGIIFLAFIGLYSYYQLTLNGQSTFLSGGRHEDTGSALFFSNLKYFNAFFFNSLLNDSFIVNRLSGGMYAVYNAIKLLFTLLLLLFAVRIALKDIRSDKGGYLGVLTISTIAVNILFLAFLSVKYKLDTNADNTWAWTYVKEFRYYSPSYFMFFLLLLRKYADMQKLEKLVVKTMIAPLMLIGVVYSFYTILSGNTNGTFPHDYKDYNGILAELKRSSTDNSLIIVNGWNRELDNTARGSLFQLYGWEVYHDFGKGNLPHAVIAGKSKIQSNAMDKLWVNSPQFAHFDKVFYIGDDSLIKAELADSDWKVAATPVARLHLITRAN